MAFLLGLISIINSDWKAYPVFQTFIQIMLLMDKTEDCKSKQSAQGHKAIKETYLDSSWGITNSKT